jgi:hypothetical protein
MMWLSTVRQGIVVLATPDANVMLAVQAFGAMIEVNSGDAAMPG